MYGDGIPERVNLRLGNNESTILINGNTFGSYHGIADYQLATKGDMELPKAGKLGVTIIDDSEGVRISKFTIGSAAQDAGIVIGDRIVALDGVKVANLVDLKSMMFDKKPGEKVKVAIQRYLSVGNQKEMQFEVVLR
jgi:S1-C subfamily serine protease